eukprot:9743679-Lingulodinium_polyedra.AAC.1
MRAAKQRGGNNREHTGACKSEELIMSSQSLRRPRRCLPPQQPRTATGCSQRVKLHAEPGVCRRND